MKRVAFHCISYAVDGISNICATKDHGSSIVIHSVEREGSQPEIEPTGTIIALNQVEKYGFSSDHSPQWRKHAEVVEEISFCRKTMIPYNRKWTN